MQYLQIIGRKIKKILLAPLSFLFRYNYIYLHVYWHYINSLLYDEERETEYRTQRGKGSKSDVFCTNLPGKSRRNRLAESVTIQITTMRFFFFLFFFALFYFVILLSLSLSLSFALLTSFPLSSASLAICCWRAAGYCNSAHQRCIYI